MRTGDVPSRAVESPSGIAETYRSLLGASSAGFCVVRVIFDAQGQAEDCCFVAVNGAFERDMGLVDASGRTSRELRPALDVPWLDRYERIAATGQAERFEDEVPSLGRRFDVCIWRVGEAGDHLVGVSARDITRREHSGRTPEESNGGTVAELSATTTLQAISARTSAESDGESRITVEEALRASDERLQTILNIESLGVIILHEDGTLVGANDAFLLMHGYSREEVESGMMTWRDLTPERHVAETERQRRKLARTGRIGPYEKEYLRKDGSCSWMLVVGAALGDGTAVKYCIDISARKQAEAALRESEERFRTMADGSPVMIWVDAPDGKVEFINRAYSDFVGMTLEEVRALSWQSLLHPDDLEAYVTEFETSLREQSPFRARTRMRNAAGEWRWIESYGAPRFAPHGRFLGMVGSSPDITEQKMVEARLEEAMVAKDQFLGFVSHELRTPMTVILGMSHVLETRLDSPEQRSMAAEIASSAEELNDLIDSLLLLARVEEREDRWDGPPVLLGRVIENVVARQRQRDPGREYVYRPDTRHSIVCGEEIWIERLVLNLVGNAAKYSPPRQPVSIVLDEEESNVRVRVLDEGDGIKSDETDRLFEPFYRGSSHAAAVPGAGIGLTVCKRIVESMGGRIWARPRETSGAEFGFVLPSIPDEAE